MLLKYNTWCNFSISYYPHAFFPILYLVPSSSPSFDKKKNIYFVNLKWKILCIEELYLCLSKSRAVQFEDIFFYFVLYFLLFSDFVSKFLHLIITHTSGLLLHSWLNLPLISTLIYFQWSKKFYLVRVIYVIAWGAMRTFAWLTGVGAAGRNQIFCLSTWSRFTFLDSDCTFPQTFQFFVKHWIFLKHRQISTSIGRRALDRYRL